MMTNGAVKVTGEKAMAMNSGPVGQMGQSGQSPRPSVSPHSGTRPIAVTEQFVKAIRRIGGVYAVRVEGPFILMIPGEGSPLIVGTLNARAMVVELRTVEHVQQTNEDRAEGPLPLADEDYAAFLAEATRVLVGLDFHVTASAVRTARKKQRSRAMFPWRQAVDQYRMPLLAALAGLLVVNAIIWLLQLH